MADPGALALERLPGRPGDGLEALLALRLPSDVGLVDTVVELFARHCFDGRQASRHTLFRLRVSLAEALANAIQSGNACDPEKLVLVHAELFVDHIRLRVSDEGPGFDPSLVPDPRDPEKLESPCGRGLFIIRHLAERVEFNEKGNTIWMTLPRM
jgi:serine/threonine-protein kinase RsbW